MARAKKTTIKEDIKKNNLKNRRKVDESEQEEEEEIIEREEEEEEIIEREEEEVEHEEVIEREKYKITSEKNYDHSENDSSSDKVELIINKRFDFKKLLDSSIIGKNILIVIDDSFSFFLKHNVMNKNKTDYEKYVETPDNEIFVMMNKLDSKNAVLYFYFLNDDKFKNNKLYTFKYNIRVI